MQNPNLLRKRYSRHLSVFSRHLLCWILATTCVFSSLTPAFGRSAFSPASGLDNAAAGGDAQGDSFCKKPDTSDYDQAAKAVMDALEKIKAAQSDADAINGALKKITLDDAMLDQFRTVTNTLTNGVNKAGRFKPIAEARNGWTQKYEKLKKAYEPFVACETAGDSNADAKRVIESFKKIKNDVEAQNAAGKEWPKADQELREAIKSIPKKVEAFLVKSDDGSNGLAGIVQAVSGSAGAVAPQILRTDMPKKLPDLAKALRLRRLFPPIGDALAAALDPEKNPEIKDVPVNEKPNFKPLLQEVDKQLKAALSKVVKWAEQAADNAKDEFTAARNALLQAMRDPFHQATEAAAQATVSDAIRKDISAMAAAFQEILSETQKEDLKDSLPEGFSVGLRDLGSSVRILQGMSARLERTVAELSSDIPMDKSTWTMASVDLFYFDNVERLIRVLSPQYARSMGSDLFQKEARARREALDQASQSLETADQVVSDARTAVGNLREEVRLATLKANAATQAQRKRLEDLQRRANATEANSRTMEERRKIIENDKVQAEDRYNRAKTASEAAPDNADLKNRLVGAQDDLDASETRVARAKAEEDKSKQDATAARSDADKAATTTNEEVTELKAALTKAETELEQAEADRKTATAEQRKALQSAFLAAQVENFAFAQARDNAPFWTNFPEPKAIPAAGTPAGGTTGAAQPVNYQDSDPINRVLLFGFPDSRTLFIRGQRDNIDLVRQIIKEFDRPEGQAVMTLRTMEVSSDGTSKGTKRALEFLEMMDGEINKAQSQVERAVAILRNAINTQVKVAVAEYKTKTLDPERAKLVNEKETLAKALAAAGNDPKKKAELQVQLDINEIKITAIDVRLNMLVNPAFSEIMESVAFYDKRVLDDLGWRDDLIGQTADLQYLNAIIPRPSSTVTLAQALIVLSLAEDKNRVAILNIINTGMSKLPPEDREKKNPFSLCALLNIHHKNEDKKPDPFSSVTGFIGEDGNSSDILGFQAKLTEALRFNGITHVLEAAEALVRADVLLEQEQAALRRQIPTGGTATEIQQRQLAAINTKRQVITRDLNPMLKWLQASAPAADPERLKARIREASQDENGISTLVAEAVGLRRSVRYRFSQANESAVNLTFRKYLEQLNKGLNEAYVKPAFKRINRRLLEKKLGVGVIQETSILASNRLGARVDPRGSAQIAVGEEKNVLEAARQLTSLLGLAGKGLVTGVTGNPLSLAGGPGAVASSTLSSAQSVLNSLDQLPLGAKPEVYGIATGNLFEVTPVIDPSGQALRFRFDLVSSTQIREPNDTIDPQLPRIERHSVNTEVHLANQEIRLISQFQANSRLGKPKVKAGGIPILKDLPLLSELPLIGWFIRRGGRAAETQQSLIFCQTTMYPTLSEVLDLSVQSPTFTGLSGVPVSAASTGNN